jgi:diguanylate cyclase (GGDEF)-like protein
LTALPDSGTVWIDPEELIGQLPLPLVVFDLRDRVVSANRAACEFLRSPLDALRGRLVDELVASPGNVGKNSATLMHGGTFRDRAMIWKCLDGDFVEALGTATLVRDDLGCPIGTVYMIQPVADPARADPIRYQALHDPITGLPNRVRLAEYLQRLLDERRQTGRVPGLLFVDVDHFSRINDSLGQEAGDTILREVGRRLGHALRGEDLVARDAGDVFAVALSLSRAGDGILVAEKLLRALRRPFSYQGRDLGLTASIGIATSPPDGETPSELVQAATAAAGEAKRLGADRHAVADQRVQREIQRRFETESRLRSAIRSGELELGFQPIVGTLDGRPIAFEALLRWPGELEVTIQEVIRVAEHSGLIGELGQWVIERALAEARALLELIPEARLSVNVSGRELDDPHFVRRISRHLDRAGIDASRIELEITETALIEHSGPVIDALNQLRNRGLSLAVDDFGAGHASLGYIRNLPVNTLKIDRSLVGDIGTLNGEALVRSILTLADVLGLHVVAEGVETEEQWSFLREHSCPALQGFLFSPALAASDLRAWLRSA